MESVANMFEARIRALRTTEERLRTATSGPPFLTFPWLSILIDITSVKLCPQVLCPEHIISFPEHLDVLVQVRRKHLGPIKKSILPIDLQPPSPDINYLST
jgi:hypothetical protein